MFLTPADPDDAPRVTLLPTRTPTARKVHACGLCDEPIAKGERFRLDVWIDDGKLQSMRSHRRECWNTPEPREGRDDNR